jgi:hypothetical protein
MAFSVGDHSCCGNIIEGALGGIVFSGNDNLIACSNALFDCFVGIQFSTTVDSIENIVVSNNTMRKFTRTGASPAIGVWFATSQGTIDNVTITGNVFKDFADDVGAAQFIRIDLTENMSNVSINGNSFHTADVGILASVAAGTMTNFSIQDNIFDSVSLPSSGTVYTGAGSILRNNIGFITENSGTATLLNANTTIAVTHGLDITPTVINIAWRENPTNTIEDWWIDTIGSSTFTLNGVDPGASNLDFGWEAKVR